MRPLVARIRSSFNRSLSFCILAAFFSAGLWGQEGGGPAVDKETVQLLMKRIDQLEARVRELELGKQAAATKTAGPAAAPAAPASDPPSVSAAKSSVPVPAESRTAPSSQTLAASQAAVASSNSAAHEGDQTQPENATPERTDLSKTLLRIRGFGDVALHGDTMKGDTTAFSLGQLDLFITSDMSEKFKFLADILFEGGPDNVNSASPGPANSLNVDVERYTLQYSLNDYLNIAAGKGHAGIGYYSTAYQHSTWLQTAIGRPFLYEFEDRGGILPIHMVGVSASGAIPSKAAGLHYVAEVGDGRGTRTSLEQEDVATSVDDENHIAYNLGVFARPDSWPGVQTGFSFYHDVQSPPKSHKIAETILAAHAILTRPRFEWLNEAVLDRQSVVGTANTFNTPAFYTQISRQYGLYRPYLRYQYMNVSKRQPVFPDVGLRYGPSAGVRYDASESVALKFQYDYTYLRKQPGVHGLTMQVGFTF